MEHDGCKGCKYEHETEESIYCKGCKQNAVDKYVKQTNADWIRGMSNHELAEILIAWDEYRDRYGYISHSDKHGYTTTYCDNRDEAIKKQLEWLESECDT